MTAGMVLLSGLLLAAGVVALVTALVPATPRLTAALERIDGVGVGRPGPGADVGPIGTRSERLGAYAYRHSPTALSARQRRDLQLQGTSIAEFYADKALIAVIGAVAPLLLGLGYGLLAGSFSAVPVVVSLVGAVGGFLLPDLLLKRSSKAARTAAVEALLVFIDLVTLERLANASATQALHNAAGLSEQTLFRQIRVALDRARLEQQSPYAELRRLAEQLDLPELVDVADVMQLDESGATLSGALRARVRELRDAHLTREQIAAAAASEGMTVYMTLPALVFGLILLVAAMLRLVLGIT